MAFIGLMINWKAFYLYYRSDHYSISLFCSDISTPQYTYLCVLACVSGMINFFLSIDIFAKDMKNLPKPPNKNKQRLVQARLFFDTISCLGLVLLGIFPTHNRKFRKSIAGDIHVTGAGMFFFGGALSHSLFSGGQSRVLGILAIIEFFCFVFLKLHPSILFYAELLGVFYLMTANGLRLLFLN